MAQHTSQSVAVLQYQGDEVVLTLFRFGQQPASERVMLSKSDSQSLLIRLVQFLDAHQSAVDALTGLIVVPGDSRFTISRLVAVIANAAAWSASIPVVQSAEMPADAAAAFHAISQNPPANVTPLTLLAPQYSKEPRIT